MVISDLLGRRIVRLMPGLRLLQRRGVCDGIDSGVGSGVVLRRRTWVICSSVAVIRRCVKAAVVIVGVPSVGIDPHVNPPVTVCSMVTVALLRPLSPVICHVMLMLMPLPCMMRSVLSFCVWWRRRVFFAMRRHRPITHRRPSGRRSDRADRSGTRPARRRRTGRPSGARAIPVHVAFIREAVVCATLLLRVRSIRCANGGERRAFVVLARPGAVIPTTLSADGVRGTVKVGVRVGVGWQSSHVADGGSVAAAAARRRNGTAWLPTLAGSEAENRGRT